MKWSKKIDGGLPIKFWLDSIEKEAMQQAENLARHPVTVKHVALMPDCHVGYGMPIGGVIACKNAVIPNAVGVDIGCGMIAVETNCPSEKFSDIKVRRALLDELKKKIPLGEGISHKNEQKWDGFEKYLDSNDNRKLKTECPSSLDRKNLGTLGGGNHFIELQSSDSGNIWLMIHSGSRNLGYRIADYYHKKAFSLNEKLNIPLPSKDLAFLPLDDDMAFAYIRDMNFALEYALENRQRMMNAFKESIRAFAKDIKFIMEVNIHHNYAALEKHFDEDVWIHRKGATSAKKDETGIIPGSMGTASYIVKGLGNPESFMSCSHGAGRKMGRTEASKRLAVEDCNKAMEGIAFDRWNKFKSKWKKKSSEGLYDLSEAPLAYKDIEDVINSELDLIEPIVKLSPLGVLKG